jgi:23S rRNA pseudouridine2605 synthase
VDGVTVTDPEHRVDLDRSRLSVDGERVRPAPPLYLVLNKPRGLVATAEDERGRETVYRCLPAGLPWVAPVGRLDRASEGLLLFTNDTGWAARLLDPRSHVWKTYHVQVDRVADAGLLRQVTDGVVTDRGDRLGAVGARRLRHGTRTSWIEVTLDEGRNRHIRRLLEALGVRVLRLVRVAIGPLALGDLAKGQVRPLTPEEAAALASPVGQQGKARGVLRPGLASPARAATAGSRRRRRGPET